MHKFVFGSSLNKPLIPRAEHIPQLATQLGLVIAVVSITSMRNPSQEHVVGIPVGSAQASVDPQKNYDDFCHYKQKKVDSVFKWMDKFSRKADNITQGIREHVKLGPKISETVKGKLSLGARILQAGGIERVFRRLFNVGQGEKLLKVSQCYLSTSAGPISGLLFISTDKVAFHSDKTLRIPSPSGEVIRTPYKVVIPLGKIKRANPCENLNKSRQKYIQIVTVDDFEFFFMGFLNYQRSFRCLQMATLRSPMSFLQLQRRDVKYLCNVIHSQ